MFSRRALPQVLLFGLLLVLLFVLSLITALPARAAIVVTDDLGRKVALDKPARRIVALAPHIIENLYTAGAGEWVVGAVEYCDYPEAAKTIPRVGAISAYSLEAIIALKPDLVVIWHSGLGGKMLPQLQALGLTVYANDPKTLDDVPRALRDFAVLAEVPEQGERVAAAYRARLQKLRQDYSEENPLSVLYQVWHQPLQTLNDEHIISDIIRLCGGRNVFGDAVTIAPVVSIESVITRNPEVILASGIGEERPEWLDYWHKYPGLSAAQNQNLYAIPPDLIQRHTVRILDGAERVCAALAAARAKRKQGECRRKQGECK
jgi:iron complex transport system substrate-binding protein